MERFCLLFAAVHGFLAVAFGAFGAHSLKAKVASLPPEDATKILGWVETGARYELMHAVALLALAALWSKLPTGPATLAAYGFAWGALAFSVSLYAMALGVPGSIVGPITPLGGLGLLLGWGALAWAAFSL